MKENKRKKQFNNLLELSNWFLSKRNVFMQETDSNIDIFDGDTLYSNAVLEKDGAFISIDLTTGTEDFFIPICGNNPNNLEPQKWLETLGREESLYYSVIR